MQLNVKDPIIITTGLFLNKVVDGDGLILKNIFNKEDMEIRFL